MAVIKGINARIYQCDDATDSVQGTGLGMTPNGTRTQFTCTDTAKRFWDPSKAIVVKLGGTPIATYSSIQYPGARVNFATDPGAGSLTVDVYYFAVSNFIQCKSWELAAEFDYMDATCFGDVMRINMPAMRSATASVQGFHLQPTGAPDPGDDRFLLLVNANRVGLDLFVDATASSEKRYACYARTASVITSAAVDALIEQPLTFNVVDGPYYVAGLGVA